MMAISVGSIVMEVHVKGIGKSRIGLKILRLVAKIFDLKLEVELKEPEASHA
jgi:hypothetical protein